ncbi:MAG: hypothetical protein IJG60_01275 [Thermoguttaceae bacterium]|nr:hypothetical protein [Thermoguttaceae bacterium]
MDEFVLPVSLVYAPFCFYICFLLLLGLRKFPTVMRGTAEKFLFAFGLSGFVILQIAPAIFPLRTLDLYGIYAYAVFLLLYLLIVFLLASCSARKLYIYNITEEDIRKIPEIPFFDVSSGDAPQASQEFSPAEISPACATRLRRAGNNLIFPEAKLILSVEYFVFPVSGAVLRSSETNLSAEQWRALLGEVNAYVSTCRQNLKRQLLIYLLWLGTAVFGCCFFRFLFAPLLNFIL